MTEPVLDKAWKRRIVEKVPENERDRKRWRDAHRGPEFHIRLSVPFRRMIIAAAKARGISLTGYIRRAVARQVAKDLGLEWEYVLAHCAYPPAFGKTMPPQDKLVYRVEGSRRVADRLSTVDDGTGYGDWTN